MAIAQIQVHTTIRSFPVSHSAIMVFPIPRSLPEKKRMELSLIACVNHAESQRELRRKEKRYAKKGKERKTRERGNTKREKEREREEIKTS